MHAPVRRERVARRDADVKSGAGPLCGLDKPSAQRHRRVPKDVKAGAKSGYKCAMKAIMRSVRNLETPEASYHQMMPRVGPSGRSAVPKE
jgi:hypothetical protein